MSRRWMWLLAIAVAFAPLSGCSDDDSGPGITTPSETAFEAMAAAGKAYINDNTQCPGVIDADLVSDNLGDYTVIDVRAAADFAAGHIPGAYNATLGNVLQKLRDGDIPTNKPFVIACYTGQSAGHVKIGMELLGYGDVYSLKFGMSAWNTGLSAPWDNNTGDNLGNPETTNNNAGLTDHGFPNLSGSAGSIVEQRVEWMLQQGFKAKSYADIRDNLDDYFILNYFGEGDYMGTGTSGTPGHIPGSYQFTPYESLGDDEMLKNLPTDKPIIVYCWTGQHSSQVTAYLNMLGYEAYSLKFGSNNLFHSNLTAHKWGDGAKNDYDIETGFTPTPTFQAIAEAGMAYINDNTDCPGVLSAVALNDNLADYTVIDIRAAADYDAGHIPGAYNATLGNVLQKLDSGDIPTNKPFVIACYTGQSAGHVKFAMEMMGYEDVYSLLFGMASWNTSLTAPWDNNCKDELGNPETVNNNGDLGFHEYPSLAGETVEGRVNAMLAAGFKATSYADIRDNLGEYFVVNYFGEADYMGTGTSGVPGHIPGAFQFTPYASLGMGEMLANLPTDMPIVVYCWTGQHSSQVTAYLNMLGYEAYSLKFGSNNLFHNSLTAHKWSAAQMHDFMLEPTPLLTVAQ